MTDWLSKRYGAAVCRWHDRLTPASLRTRRHAALVHDNGAVSSRVRVPLQLRKRWRAAVYNQRDQLTCDAGDWCSPHNRPTAKECCARKARPSREGQSYERKRLSTLVACGPTSLLRLYNRWQSDTLCSLPTLPAQSCPDGNGPQLRRGVASDICRPIHASSSWRLRGSSVCLCTWHMGACIIFDPSEARKPAFSLASKAVRTHHRL